jgi:hypothetical protein
MGWIDHDGETAEARELQLYIDNDADLYRQRYMPIVRNLKKKIDKGIFDPALAPKLLMYLVNDGAKKYDKEFGDMRESMFTKEVREEVARNMAKEIEDAINTGEWDTVEGVDPLNITR